MLSTFLSPKALPFYLLLGLAYLAGCNMPGRTATPSDVRLTEVYQTIEAQLTQAALTHSPQPWPNATQVTFQTPTATPLLTISPSPTVVIPSATPRALCDQAAPGTPIDVTIPDDTQLQPGQVFTKIWRLQNVGTCTWTRAYAVTFFSGDQLGAPSSVPLPGEVAPGQSVDIAVDMIAPTKPGKYQGNWKLRNASNVLFGIGPNGSAPFWVRIEVVQPSTSTPTPTATIPGPTATASPTVTPIAQVVGNANLAVNNTLDLDTNQINVSGADLSYQTNAEGQHLLIPQSSALLGVYGNNQPSLTNCQAAALGTSPLVVETIPMGTYICYRTDQGRYGRARLSNFNPDTYALTLEILTWPLP